MTVTTPPRPSGPDVIHDSGDPQALDEPLIGEARTGSDQPGDPEALIEEARRRTRRRRRGYSACALLAVAGALAYFGLASGGGADVPAPPADAEASFPAVPADPNATYFELWFSRPSLGGCCVTFPTWRTAAQLGISPDEDIHTRREINGPDENRRATDLLEGALTSLIAGPTPADRELLAERARDAGFPGWGNSWLAHFPPDTQLLGVTLSNGIATIDISHSDEFGNADPYVGPHNGVDQLFSGLVFTVMQFPFVDGVLFKLDGQPVTAQIPNVQALEAGLDDASDIYERVGRPVTRADYEGTRGDDVFSRQGPATRTHGKRLPSAAGIGRGAQ